MQQPHLRFEITGDGVGPIVKVFGEVDIMTAPDLLEAIRVVHDNDGHDVVLDLSGVGFMDSRGLATLVIAHRHLAERGRRLRVQGARPNVERLLSVTGVGEHRAGTDGAGADPKEAAQPVPPSSSAPSAPV